MKTKLDRYLSVFLTVILICVGCSLSVLAAASAETEAELEERLLGTVSAKYESNGDPGNISSGNGDPGGASYGAYQFAGNYNVPISFANWLVSSGKDPIIGDRLQRAYSNDGDKFSTNFVNEWKAIAAESHDWFLKLQHDYVKYSYYDPAVASLKANLGLDVNHYSIALKNAVWSRAIQHGVGSYSGNSGAMGLFRKVNEAVSGGILSLSEDQIITAVYKEAGATKTDGKNPMSASSAGSNAWIITKYNLEGLTMKHYGGSSSAVQASVWLRLNVNELNELLEMYRTYHVSVVPGWTKITDGNTGVNVFDSSDNVILTVPGDISLIVTGESENGRLPVTITYLGTTYEGFCDANCISFSEPLHSVVQLAKIDNATTSVNIRQYPTTESAILASVPVGTRLRITGPIFNNWYSVELTVEGRKVRGYCYGQYVTLENDGAKLRLGDINMDDRVTTADALLALQNTVKKIELTGLSLDAADVDFSGNITTADALLILQYAVEKIRGF